MVIGRRAYLKSLEDEQLIGIFKEKQWSACIDELYRRYGHLVYGVQLKYTKSVLDAEDLTMECFSKLPAQLLQHDITFFKGWLHTVARNLALSFLRKNKIGTTTFLDEQQLHADQQEDTLDIALQLDLLEWAITQLKEQQKTCIELFYLNQQSYEQIMAQTAYSYSEVKSYIQNGRRNLKLLIEQKETHESK